MKVAIFGSAFNPPTKGHVDAIQSIWEHDAEVDRILLVPSYKHAFSKTMLDYALRVEMLKSFVADIDDSRVEVMAVEHLIAEGEKPVYTYDLLSYLQQTLSADTQLYFAIGPDNAQNWSRFYRAEDIIQQWSLISVPQRQPIRSTMVRERRQNRRDASELVTPSVNTFLETHQLYV